MADRDKGSFRIYDSSKEMSQLEQVVGVAAIVVDALFFLILILMTSLSSEVVTQARNRRWKLIGATACAIALAMLYVVSDSVSVSL